MHLFSKKFWYCFWHDPREAVDSLKRQNNWFTYQLVKVAIFLRIVFAEYLLNHCMTRSSALAYALLLTLVPLVVTGALMLAGLVDVKPEQIEELLGTLLPFAPDTVLNYISLFYVNARTLRGPGIVILIVIAIGLFGAAEESFNTIWKITRPRSFFSRLRSFTMVMVYSPILFSLSFFIRHSKWLEPAADFFFLLDALPFFLMALAFTTLIWFLPNTRVRFGSALLGGLVAGILIELERHGFGMYVRMSMQMQNIYGTFGILLLFLISIYVVWLLILLGTEVAYVHQNFRALLRAQKRWDRRVGDYKIYLTFRIFTDAVSAFILKKRPPDLVTFIRKYELTEPQARGLVNWLIHANLLHSTSSRNREGYVPTRDFSKQSVGELLNEIKAQDLKITATPDDYAREFVSSLLHNCHGDPGTLAGKITFEDMVITLEEGENRFSKTARPGK